jgi:hypothetical protein
MKNFALLLFLTVTTITLFSACGDDDAAPGISSLLPYDASEHIYATLRIDDVNEWEAVVSPATGQFDTLPGTYRSVGSISFPNGTKRLSAFLGNKRIFISEIYDSELYIQDLETLDYEVLELKETDGGSTVIFPQFLRFGANEDELYLLDTDGSVWKIHLQNKEVEKILADILPTNNEYVSNFYYLKSDDKFLVSTNDAAINAGTMTNLYLVDAETDSVLTTTEITETFGLVQHPDSPNNFYCLQVPNDDAGFRLWEIQVQGESINTGQKSSSDLPIDELSIYIQTIHTATDSYICRGGSNSFDNPTNTLYTIDLTSGELAGETDFFDSAFFVKMAGE